MSKAIAGKKAAAFSAAFAIALSAGVVGADATVAQAAEQGQATETTTTTPSKDTVDPSTAPTEGLSLTIHKLKGTESGQQGNGTKQDLPNDPAENVGYKVELVQELNTPADWNTAAGIDVESATPKGEPVFNGKTDANGEINLTDLKPGLYKVTETSVPDDSGLIIAKPFLVYVPMTNPEKTGWISNVHAYPKNTEVKVEKKVKDQFANNGEDYTYTITSSVPLKKKDEKLTKYIVTDELDSKLDGANSKVTKVALGAKEDGAEVLTAGTHYNVEAVPGNDQIKKVVFTQAGLDKLTDSSLQVFTTIQTKTVDNATVYHVPNDAELTVSHDPKGEYDTTVTSKKVHTYWGDLKIVKQDGDSKKKLEGAEFELVQCQADGDAWKQTANTSAEEVKGKTSWTTDKNGTVTIEGIHVTDFADNEKKDNDYCLKETKAPKGYFKNDALIPFELKKEDGKVNKDTGVPTADIKYTATIDNYTEKNHLPNTGGAGFIAIVMAGLAIIGGGFFAARRNSVKA